MSEVPQYPEPETPYPKLGPESRRGQNFHRQEALCETPVPLTPNLQPQTLPLKLQALDFYQLGARGTSSDFDRNSPIPSPLDPKHATPNPTPQTLDTVFR